MNIEAGKYYMLNGQKLKAAKVRPLGVVTFHECNPDGSVIMEDSPKGVFPKSLVMAINDNIRPC